LSNRLEETGYRIDCADAWIAATAIAVGGSLLTNNKRDFAGVTGLTVMDPDNA
jgi:predicted nucleic acid-binding protein